MRKTGSGGKCPEGIFFSFMPVSNLSLGDELLEGWPETGPGNQEISITTPKRNVDLIH